MSEVAIVLHNIRSAHNVGSIFRTADAAGTQKIYLTGYTPLPSDHFGRVQKDIAKTALGAELFVSWEHRFSPSALLRTLKKEGWCVIGVEQDAGASDFRTALYPPKCAFLFGNEVRGLSRPLRALCDELVEIPMRGKKESLNVAVAVGIILFGSMERA